jgi:hypothetical protein
MICDCIFHVIASLHPNPHCTHLHIVTSDKITTPVSSPRERPRARNDVVGGGNLHEGFVSLDMHHELDIAGLGAIKGHCGRAKILAKRHGMRGDANGKQLTT